MKTTHWIARIGLPLLLVASLLGACHRHSVPLGGACERTDDCATGPGQLLCSATPAQPHGICTQSCSIWPAGANVTGPDSRGVASATCPSGMICRAVSPEHPQLGPSYCDHAH